VLRADAVLRVGCRVRVIGLSGHPQHNGIEGRTTAYDATKDRWAVAADTQVKLSAKSANLEPLSAATRKAALAQSFLRHALDNGYEDHRRNGRVFDILYDRSAREKEGVNLFFAQLWEMGRSTFDALYSACMDPGQ